jgi:cytidyltransferase-like protein
MMKKLIPLSLFLFSLFLTQAYAGVLNAQNLKNCKNIAIVAGTYDPFTNGHELMGKEILKKLDFDCVVYLPTGNPPHKIASPLQTRYEMMEAALKNEPNLFYPDAEDLKISPKEYVAKLKSFGGDTRKVYAVLGSDLSPQNRMYYINRYRLDPDGYIITGRGTEQIEIAKAFENRPYHVVPVDESYSSTQARKWFVANEDVYFKKGDIGETYPSNVLRKEVAQYIKDKGLYLGSDGVTTRSPGRILKTAFTQGLNKLGLFTPLREVMVKKNAQAELTSIVINGETLPLKKHLGSGLTADAYIFNYKGEDMVIKIANQRLKSPGAIKQDVTIGNWLNHKTSIHVPEVVDMHPDGNWKITQLIKGESLKDYMKRTNGVIEPVIEEQLRKAVSDMLEISRTTNTKLDLSVDNLKIWNGKVYLIDAGPIPPDVSHPVSYEAFLAKWKSQTKPGLGTKCKNLWAALQLLKPVR